MSRELPEGFTVKYRHERDEAFIPPRFDRFDELGAVSVSPKGGKTEAFIFDSKGNEVATGEAVCRPDENFDKALGRTIALGRALQELEKKQPPPRRGIGRIIGTRKRRPLRIQAS